MRIELCKAYITEQLYTQDGLRLEVDVGQVTYLEQLKHKTSLFDLLI